MRLGELNIADTLKQAASVQFYVNEDGSQPSAIALVFNDWDHLLGIEADKAYNLLEDRCKSMPKCEIKTNPDKTIDLRIWDIFVDLDIRLSKLPYSEEELQNFTVNAKPDKSLAFVLALPTKGKNNLGIAPTKRGDDFPMITLHGYVLKS
jgi:hypothetical protein